MARKTNATIQQEFDVTKWLDSEKAGRDTCGTYEICAFCDKKTATPCAKAFNKRKTAQSETIKA